MTTTRKQAAKEQELKNDKEGAERETEGKVGIGDKRQVDEATGSMKQHDDPPTKKVKVEEEKETKKEIATDRQTGTIERGHIYFFYRPKVQVEEAHSIDDIQNLLMLLVPRPPKFSMYARSDALGKVDNEEDELAEMEVLAAGADAKPAPETLDDSKKHYRLIVIGKKHMPNPEVGGSGRGRKQTFWATVTAVGDDLHSLERGLSEKTYETKTRGGIRHQESVRLAARGAYAIVNNDPKVPSDRVTHFGYHISHPKEMGSIQVSLGISTASAFVLQIKNPLAPSTIPRMRTKGSDYPDEILRDVFGKGTKGRESYGLRFVDCEVPELLDYEGTELLLIAARGGEEGVEDSLKEGRGTALKELEEEESEESLETVFREISAVTNKKILFAQPHS